MIPAFVWPVEHIADSLVSTEIKGPVRASRFLKGLLRFRIVVGCQVKGAALRVRGRGSGLKA